MNRPIWTRNLTSEECPPWPCPICRTGTVGLVSKSLEAQETTTSKREQSDPDWEHEWVKYDFTAWGECGNPKCKQRFAIAGTGGVTLFEDYEEGISELGDYFEAKFCSPMPEMIELPKGCPKDVRVELSSAFEMFWQSPAACAGRIRVALECLLDGLGVPGKKKTKKGGFYQLSLHERIEVFASKNTKIGEQLMALKWLGNSGSHTGAVTQRDLLDAFEVLEHCLGEIVEKRSDRIASLAKKLTAAHKKKR